MYNYLMILLVLFGSIRICGASTMPSDPEKYPYAIIIQLLYSLDDFRDLLLDNKEAIDKSAQNSAVWALSELFFKIKNGTDITEKELNSRYVQLGFTEKIDITKADDGKNGILNILITFFEKLFRETKTAVPGVHKFFEELFALSVYDANGGKSNLPMSIVRSASGSGEVTDAGVLDMKNKFDLKQLHLSRYIFVVPNQNQLNDSPITEFIRPAYDYRKIIPITPVGKYLIAGALWYGDDKDLVGVIRYDGSFKTYYYNRGQKRVQFGSDTYDYSAIGIRIAPIRIYVKAVIIEESLENFANSLTRLSNS